MPLLIPLDASTAESVKSIKWFLTEVLEWMWANKLMSRRYDPKFKVSSVLDRVALPLKEQVHSLGVILDSGLLPNNQVMAKSRNAFYYL